MRTKLIGLCGYAGAGKDATAALLRMVGYRRVAFADQVKEEIFDRLKSPDMEMKLILAEVGLCLEEK